MKIEYSSEFQAPDSGSLEVVERKGLGHPDTLVDGIVEASAIEYANYCIENFGAIPHHNLDKASLIGGLCVQSFGGGSFESPLNMLFMGRASRSFGGEVIPLDEIQDQTARDYLNRIMPHLDTENPGVFRSKSLTSTHSTRPYWFAPRTIDDLPEYDADGPFANDTATMISYWPLTDTESLALDMEGFFYDSNEEGLPLPRLDFVGQDIKVMCVRNGDTIDITMAVPQVTSHTPDMETYLERHHELEKELQNYAETVVEDRSKVAVHMTRDGRTQKPRLYLVTGGSCTDFGEEGAVGRGNKTHGIIASFRPNTMEAPHGKNPTYFVGKILGYQADLIAKQIHKQLDVRSQVVLQANMGDKLFEPSSISVATDKVVDQRLVEPIVESCLSLGRKTTTRIIDDKYYLPRANIYRPL